MLCEWHDVRTSYDDWNPKIHYCNLCTQIHNLQFFLPIHQVKALRRQNHYHFHCRHHYLNDMNEQTKQMIQYIFNYDTTVDRWHLHQSRTKRDHQGYEQIHLIFFLAHSCCLHTHMRACTHTHTHARTHTHTCTPTCTHAPMHMCAHTLIHMHACTHTHMTKDTY